MLRRQQAQQEHDECKELFDMLNDQLIAELPQLLDLRVPYFDPSFEAMIRMQAKFAEEGYEKLSGVQRYDIYSYGLFPLIKAFCPRYFGDSVRDDYAAGQLDAQVCISCLHHRFKFKSPQTSNRLKEFSKKCESFLFVEVIRNMNELFNWLR